MKKLVLLAPILLTLAAIPIPEPAPGAPPEFGFVTNRVSNSVTVFDSTSGNPLIEIPVGAQPHAVVAVAARDRVYVSNSGVSPGTVSVIRISSLTVVNTVSVTNSSAVRGMTLSPDGKILYLAGNDASGGFATIFALNLDTETVSTVHTFASGSSAVEDVVAVSDGALGGAQGLQAGKFYLSQPGADEIHVLDVFPATAASTITLATEVATPGRMSKAPDESFVYAACVDAGPTNAVNLLEINTLTDAASVVVVDGTNAGVSLDVTFREGTAGPPYTVYVTADVPFLNDRVLWEYNPSTGAVNPGVSLGSMGLSVTHHATAAGDRLYLGDFFGGAGFYDVYNSAFSPPQFFQSPGLISGGGPTEFAFASRPTSPEAFGYVSEGGTDTVKVFKTSDGSLVTQVPVGPVPAGLVVVHALRRVFVANSAANPGTISAIDGDTFAVQTLTIPDSRNLRGVCAAADGSALFVGGTRLSTSQGAVFRLDLVSQAVSLVAEAGAGGAVADCSVVPAFAVGGSGAGPGKLYFSLPGNDLIGVHNFLSPSTSTFGPPAGTSTPTEMDVSPAGDRVWVGCSSLSGLDQRVIAIDTTTDAPSVINVAGSTGSYVTTGVAFRKGSGLTPVAYVLGNTGSATQLYEFNAVSGTLLTATGLGANDSFATAAHHVGGGEDRLYVGHSNTGVTAFGRVDVFGRPPNPPAYPPTALAAYSSGPGPFDFGFLDPPAPPRVHRTCPKYGDGSAGSLFAVEGSNFSPSAVVKVDLGVAPVTLPTTFVNSGRLVASIPGALSSGIYRVIVENPDFQSSSLQQGYVVGANSLFPVTAPMPSASQGYRMQSFPQYGTIDQLRSAFEAKFGPYNPVFYRVFFWKNGSYHELNDPALEGTCDISGRAFWVITRFGGDLTLDTPDIDLNTPSTFITIPIEPGWNMIALPGRGLTGVLPWTQTQVAADGSDLLTSVAVSAAPYLMSPNAYEYVNGNYQPATDIVRGEGYFVYNATSAWIHLVIDLNAAGGKPGPAKTARAPAGPLPPPPPGAPIVEESSRDSGCGLLGLELLLLLAFRRARRSRRLGA